MFILITLAIIVITTLLVVGVLNNIQQQRQLRRLQQRRLRIQVEQLNEIISCIEQTLPNPKIAVHLNNQVIELLQEILKLEEQRPELIEGAIAAANKRSAKLSLDSINLSASYQRDSDSQIAKAQFHINETIEYLPHLATRGKISNQELDTYLDQLRWAYLMIPVMSFIGQGDKSMAMSDRFSAQAFYRKAQHLLLESLHSDPRRLKLIKEIGEMIVGERPTLSRELRNPVAIGMD